MSSKNSSPAVAKKNLRSNSSSFSLLDIQKLIAESEERIIKQFNIKFDLLSEKIALIESAMSEVKMVQVQQGSEIENIKNIIVSQQHQIENYEENERKCNLVISNLVETDVSFAGGLLAGDEAKTLALANAILPPDVSLKKEDILESSRIGRPGGRPRLLKVRLSEVRCRNVILRHSRNLNSPTILNTFGRIFVNKDMSFLRRQEEKRLRDKYREMKNSYPDSSVRLRDGKLFLGPAVKDRVDFRNVFF
jgi:hypothetical protein